MEDIMLSEISQKNKYHILSLMWNLKNKEQPSEYNKKMQKTN